MTRRPDIEIRPNVPSHWDRELSLVTVHPLAAILEDPALMALGVVGNGMKLEVGDRLWATCGPDEAQRQYALLVVTAIRRPGPAGGARVGVRLLAKAEPRPLAYDWNFDPQEPDPEPAKPAARPRVV